MDKKFPQVTIVWENLIVTKILLVKQQLNLQIHLLKMLHLMLLIL
jgi:hypothetical protein